MCCRHRQRKPYDNITAIAIAVALSDFGKCKYSGWKASHMIAIHSFYLILFFSVLYAIVPLDFIVKLV